MKVIYFQKVTPTTTGSARVNLKEIEVRRAKKRKRIEAERAKPPTLSLIIGALIGEEE